LFTHNRSGDDRSPHPVAVIEVDRTCRADLCTGAATNAKLSWPFEIQMGKPAGIRVGHPKRLDSHFAAGSHAKTATNADVATQASPGFIFCHRIGQSFFNPDIVAFPNGFLNISLRHHGTAQMTPVICIY
jgi:hypothetical protein